MLHEVLMALAGFDGCLFTNNFMDMEHVNFIHPGEKAIVKRILKISADYKDLKTFIEKNKYNSELRIDSCTGEEVINEEKSELQRGTYIYAFCDSLAEVLEPYKKDISALEKEVLNDPDMPLTYIMYRAEKYYILLNVLNKITVQISLEKVHGCQILGFLHRHLSTGFQEVKSAVQQILHGCHVVLFKQLSNWLLYGQLADTYKEFFIQHIEDSASLQSLSLIKTSSKDSVHEYGNRSLYPAFCEYCIDFSMLPPYIAASLAYKILFVGQAVLMFGSDPREKTELVAVTQKNTASIWDGKEEMFFLKLQELRRMEIFNVIEFERTIDEIRSCVTEHLWQLAIEKGELFLQLKLMKDFFLLGRGELFLEFIRQAGHVLDKVPSSNSNRDVNQAFHIAARMVLMNDESSLEKFYFSLPVSEDSVNAGLKGWQLLSLNYRVSWPLHLLFSPEVLANYNHLFGFLLHVKKTQFDLHNVWRNQLQRKLMVCDSSEKTIWQLRHNLIFIINNLQYYLQVDVLESQYMQLQTSILTTKDFEKVQQAHILFQTNVLSQTFILMGTAKPDETSLLVPTDKTSGFKKNPVHRSLTSFLSLCEVFCAKVSQWKSPLSVEQEAELQTMIKEFMKLLKFLLQVLASLRSQPCGTHLSQLLLRLDFNRWFSDLNVSTSVTNL